MIDGRRGQIGTALVGLAVVLFVVPSLVPVQPVLFHDTDAQASDTPAELEEQGANIVAYENLSDRGKELYRQTLENGGELRVPRDSGAPEFEYPTDDERAAAFENESSRVPGLVVIRRPADDEGLPPSDERFIRGQFEAEAGAEGEGDRELNESQVEQRRQQVLRHDAMMTRTGSPPLNAPSQLLRLGAVVLAVLSLGAGGYILSLPSKRSE